MTQFCLECGVANADDADLCRACGKALQISPQQRREGVAFVLNELETLKRDMTLPGYVYSKLRRRYLTELAPAPEQAAPSFISVAEGLSPQPPPSPRPAAPAAAAPSAGPSWLAEQQANLLLYLGAFLIVIAALILVGYSEDAIGGAIKMSLLVVYTLLFLATGFICMRFQQVRQAGVVFFAVGALMVPLNFVGAYVFFFADEDMDPTGLWLAGSLNSALFYGAVAMLGISRWYSVPAVAAVVSAFAALLVLVDAPPEAYPACSVAVAALLAAPSLLKLGKVSDVFGTAGRWAAHIVVPGAICFSVGWAEPNAGLWLNISLTAAVFYGAAAFLGVGWLYAIPTVAALGSALGAILVLADAPAEAYPMSFAALGLLLTAPSLLKMGRVSEVFADTGQIAAHAAVPAVVIAALRMTELELDTRAYLPLTGVLATLFYGAQAFWASRRKPEFEPYLSVAALGVAGGTAVSLVYALDLGREWYGPAVAIVGWLYAGASEGFGPRWFGQRYLGWMALAAITVSWLAFEGLYADFSRQGAGVHFAAVVLYLVAARLSKLDTPLSAPTDSREDARVYRLPLTVPLIYAAGVALFGGFFHLLASLPAAETAGESDLAWPYFGLSLAVAAVAATMRWWWPAVRPHAYVIALAISMFVLLSSLEQEGSLALALALYTGLSLALVLWEQEALVLPIPAAYGFFAVLAAWRYGDTPDAYLPLALSGIGCAAFLGSALLRRRYDTWAKVGLVLALAYATSAPVVGWVRLDSLAQPDGFVGAEHFEETLLYQTSAASVFLLALPVVALAWLLRRVEIAAGATVLMMVALLLEIGHFRPDNVQFYTAPLGAYLLVGALLSSRLRGLPNDLRQLIVLAESLAAILIMAPSLEQSFDEGAWAYGVVLLGEGLGLVAVAIMRRRLWLLGSAIGFVVLDGLHYLFFAGGPALPPWAMLAIAGTAVMAAGTAILFGRDQWTRWQHAFEAWWSGEQ